MRIAKPIQRRVDRATYYDLSVLFTGWYMHRKCSPEACAAFGLVKGEQFELSLEFVEVFSGLLSSGVDLYQHKPGSLVWDECDTIHKAVRRKVVKKSRNGWTLTQPTIEACQIQLLNWHSSMMSVYTFGLENLAKRYLEVKKK
ncbi:hypothetical protein DUG50_22735 [Salmonella enterica subsp. enterica serovar Miami]|nr:hypothetical protein [Salmonella enterica subsp. enterica serovar Miami]